MDQNGPFSVDPWEIRSFLRQSSSVAVSGFHLGLSDMVNASNIVPQAISPYKWQKIQIIEIIEIALELKPLVCIILHQRYVPDPYKNTVCLYNVSNVSSEHKHITSCIYNLLYSQQHYVTHAGDRLGVSPQCSRQLCHWSRRHQFKKFDSVYLQHIHRHTLAHKHAHTHIR